MLIEGESGRKMPEGIIRSCSVRLLGWTLRKVSQITRDWSVRILFRFLTMAKKEKRNGETSSVQRCDTVHTIALTYMEFHVDFRTVTQRAAACRGRLWFW